jgi:hypothetical protein
MAESGVADCTCCGVHIMVNDIANPGVCADCTKNPCGPGSWHDE